MLTVIYVYEPATLTIEARDPRDEHAILRRYDQRLPPQDLHAIKVNGTVKLEPGVYALLSRRSVAIDWSNGRVETATLTKDDWPDPPSLATGASREQIKTFFGSLEKGGDVPPDGGDVADAEDHD